MRHRFTAQWCGTPLLLLLYGGSACVGSPDAVPARARDNGEALWYVSNDDRSIAGFATHANQIDIVAPLAFAMDGTGAVSGHVNARVTASARSAHVRVMPVVINRQFDQVVAHSALTRPASRRRARQQMANLCRTEGFYGLQLDLENISVGDRGALTEFVRNVADGLHRDGCVLSVAVVPRETDIEGPSEFDRWMFRNWRGVYDYARLAQYADFLSVMTYAEHNRHTPPGPVAGYPWVERALQHLLAAGVPGEKVSVGIATYSEAWRHPSPTAKQTINAPESRALSYGAAREELEAHRVSARWNAMERESVARWMSNGNREDLALSDARSFHERLRLVRAYGLRGYSAWLLGMEDPEVWRAKQAKADVE